MLRAGHTILEASCLAMLMAIVQPATVVAQEPGEGADQGEWAVREDEQDLDDQDDREDQDDRDDEADDDDDGDGDDDGDEGEGKGTPDKVLGKIVVVAPYDAGVELERVPANVQSATAEDIDRMQSLDLTDFLNRGFGSVSVNHAQNNPLQPDVNFRGFTASPLLGLSPGFTVYQNGVRINEPFGDTVNWDVIPLSAVNSVQLLAGSNPVFGLNSLGGALSLEMKNGFEYAGTEVEVYGGSFERYGASVQLGGNDDGWAYYGNVDYFEEAGWRDFSDSEALRFFGALSHQSDVSSLDLSVALADTDLIGNGSTPVELLAIDRSQVFTHPDHTENTLAQAILKGTAKLNDSWRMAGTAYYRSLDTDTFNGDGTFFEECLINGEDLLVEADFTDVNDDGECSSADDADIEPVVDQNGDPIEAQIDGGELNAVNNIGTRKQEIYGVSLQFGLHSSVGGRENDLTLGIAYSEGSTEFDSDVEVAQLLEDRGTSRTGILAVDFVTGVDSDISTSSVYFADVLALSEKAAVTFLGRYDITQIELEDQTGASPELNGSHEFRRFNPGIGFTFNPSPQLTLFASYNQSARAPTPVELACADEDAPCNLPNAFLADPPLDEVVTSSAEAGVRGTTAGRLRWNAGVFYTLSEDDILFQTTGGPTANVGFFQNASDTLRAGVELGLDQDFGRLHWSMHYTYIEATYEDDFVVNSPNHPIFGEDPGAPQIVNEEALQVSSGADIPGIPNHQFNAGADLAINERFLIGADLEYRSGVYLRGDEVNLLGRTDDYFVLNLRAEFHLNDRFTVFARVENVFDDAYETFGLLGEPDEVFENFVDPRFLGAGAPRGAWLGFKLQL
jgi:outer membrane receptor protein involved in Fe transport